MKTPFFHFTLNFRRLIAHRCRHFLRPCVNILLKFDSVKFRTDPCSTSLVFHWWFFFPLQQKYSSSPQHTQMSASSSASSASDSESDFGYDSDIGIEVCVKARVVDSGGELSCYGPKLCPAQKRSKR